MNSVDMLSLPRVSTVVHALLSVRVLDLAAAAGHPFEVEGDYLPRLRWRAGESASIWGLAGVSR